MRIARILLFLCLAAGCSDHDSIPSGVIPREEMGNIIWDMVQADQFASSYIAKDSSFVNWKDSLRATRKDSLHTGHDSFRSAGHRDSLKSADHQGFQKSGIPGLAKAGGAPPAHPAAKDTTRLSAADSSRIEKFKIAYRTGLKMETLKLYQEVFQLHNVTLEQFRESYRYYLARPDIARTLMDSVLAKANRLRTESYSHPTVADTVKKTPVLAAPGQAHGQATPSVPPPGAPNLKLPPSVLLRQRQAASAKARRDSAGTKYAKP